jgi:ribosome-associated protein
VLKVTASITIPDSDLTYTFLQSSGPGGQNVNKVATSVQLRFYLQNSTSLPDDVKARLVKIAFIKVAHDGTLVISAKRFRTQEKNRIDAEQRLVKLIQSALIPPIDRKPTKPSLSSQERRIESKKRRAKKNICDMLRMNNPSLD